MSPPPQPQANGYVTSKRAEKRRRKGRLRRPCPTPLLQSEATGLRETSSGQNTESGSAKAQNVESSYDPIDDAGFPWETHGSNPPRPLATIMPVGHGGTGRLVEQSSYGPTASYRPNLDYGIPSNEDNSYDSPAVNSLRRISRSMTQPSDSKHREFKDLSRTLTDKINMVFRSQGKTSLSSVPNENTAGRNTFSFRRGSSGPETLDKNAPGELSPRDLSPTSKGSHAPAGGLRIPTSITLRKASGADPLNAATNANNPSSSDQSILEKCQPPVIFTATSNLVAFQSKRQYNAAELPWQEEARIAGRSSSTASNSTCNQNPSLGTRLMSITRLGNPAPSQQYALPADPALTVTSFYPAQAMPSKPKSRSNSVSIERAPTRFSVVQFVSRSSIHEVIWYESDASTSRASSNPISPGNASQKSGGSIPRGVLDRSRQEGPLVSVTTAPAEASALPEVHERLSNDPLINPTSAHKRLLSWSWDNPRPSPDDFSSSSDESTESAELHKRKSNLSMRRAATAAVDAAGYFPDRKGSESTPVDGQANEQPIAKSRNEAREDEDSQEPFDRGLAMFKRRGISSGSVPSALLGSLSIGEKNGVKSAGSPLRVNTNKV